MASKEVYNCRIWEMKKGQIDGFNGMCVVATVQEGLTPCIHFMEKTKFKPKVADVPSECFVAKIARKI